MKTPGRAACRAERRAAASHRALLAGVGGVTSADGKGRVARLHHYSRRAADDPAPSDVRRVDVISPRVQVLHLA